MANFCWQDTAELFGADVAAKNDFIGIAGPGMVATVLCEGCGAIDVSPDGRCISPDCLKQHGHAP